MNMSFSMEFLSAIIGLVLTLMVFSYLIGDNPLFRFAVYLFIGSASGYAAAVVWHYVLTPKLFEPLTDPAQLLLLIVPLILSISLLAKLSPRISWIGNFAMALLVGVGAATAIGGALLGTLIPQALASVDNVPTLGEMFSNLMKGGEGIVMLLGTIVTLVYFQFGAKRTSDGTLKRNAIIEILAWLGRIFIAITFGVLFASVYMTALTAMIERWSSVINFVKSLLGL
ncbi:MAG TPA: hypothetical protein VLA72_11540 [Anaerolineales bacterium]|nr:hypothetical protein [Anaerolineales bacterium]